MFQEFWKFYPKKVGKQEAMMLFKKLDMVDQSLCIKSVPNYCKSKRVLDGYIRDPSTYLRKGFWRDFVDKTEEIKPVLSDAERDSLKSELKNLHKQLERAKNCYEQYLEFNKLENAQYWKRSIEMTEKEIKRIEGKLK